MKQSYLFWIDGCIPQLCTLCLRRKSGLTSILAVGPPTGSP